MIDLFKLLLGFVLTTVFGGALGYYFQNRAWRHQYRVRLLEADLASAAKLFEELSRLMDKRLYRMRQVHWKLKTPTSEDLVEKHMNGYREVLCEWNDALNRNLALTETYFGADIKKILESSIYEEFSRIGSLLEAGYTKAQGEEKYEWKQTADDLTNLGHRIYALNVRMIHSIQQRQQGLAQSEPYPSDESRRSGVAHNPGPQADSRAAA